jgi:curved DNA-binding protein CbpA
MAIEYDPKADYYEVLSIDVNATTEDIKKAHRARIRDLHPDRGGDTARATAVNVARAVLTDPNKRRDYDQARLAWKAQEGDRWIRMLLEVEAFAAKQRAQASRPQAAGAGRHTTQTSNARRKWQRGIGSEYFADDVYEALSAGNWLGALAVFGTGVMWDRLVERELDPDQLAALDALVAEGRRQRTQEVIDAMVNGVRAKLNKAGARAQAAPRSRSPARDTASAADRGGRSPGRATRQRKRASGRDRREQSR